MILDKEPDMFRDINAGDKKFADYPLFRRAMERSRERFNMATGNPFGTDNDQSIQMFASGKAAMLPNGTWSIATVRDLMPEGNFGLFALPADKEEDTVARLFTDDCFMISAQTQALGACNAFFEFATSGEGANIWAQYTGIIPATKGVTLTDPDPMTADAMAAKDSGKTIFADTCFQPTGQLFDIFFGKFSPDFLADQNKGIDEWIADLDAEYAAAAQ
jgi:raffinose/stachyose/melibiose transport system substrate-binding protein